MYYCKSYSLLMFYIVQRILVRREAEAAAGRIMQRLVDSIRTPPQTPPPTKADETLVRYILPLLNNWIRELLM